MPVLDLRKQFQPIRIDDHRRQLGIRLFLLFSFLMHKTDALGGLLGGVFSFNKIFNKFPGGIFRSKAGTDQQRSGTLEILCKDFRATGRDHAHFMRKQHPGRFGETTGERIMQRRRELPA